MVRGTVLCCTAPPPASRAKCAHLAPGTWPCLTVSLCKALLLRVFTVGLYIQYQLHATHVANMH